MLLHAYQHHDGAFEVVADHALAGWPTDGTRDLGVADVDLAAFSPPLVLCIGLDAHATARGADALVVERALALRDGMPRYT